jgi:hypothetical protein
VDLIELFTSEGCSSCPPADRWLGALRSDPELWREFVPVEFHVNYWDNLGWTDRFSSAAYTAREYAYASAWGESSVYTPCFVRDGGEWHPGGTGAGETGQVAGRLTVEVADGGCRAVFVPSPGDTAAHEITVALLGGGVSSQVTAGENSGATLEHEFVVLGMGRKVLARDSDGSAERATIALPRPAVEGAGRRAVAVWVSRSGELAPIQAAGGWLP